MSGEFTQVLDEVLGAMRRIESLSIDEKVQALNAVRQALHELSPFKAEPVDLVRWVPSELVTGNSYNPNSVAPAEMELLQHSIRSDGYTQPIVAFESNGKYEVVDGFHRHRVGKEAADVRAKLGGYLPIVVINQSREGLGDRMASTIRHNRARGKHAIQAMSDIVVDLSRRGWSDDRIGKELGMDPDEVLRLKQITGLADLFKDAQFSQAWDWSPNDSMSAP